MPTEPDDGLQPLGNVLSHEVREREYQFAAGMASQMALIRLKIARARLADMLATTKDDAQLSERIRVRGEAVHAEIRHRESDSSPVSGFFRGIKVGIFGAGETDVHRITQFK